MSTVSLRPWFSVASLFSLGPTPHLNQHLSSIHLCKAEKVRVHRPGIDLRSPHRCNSPNDFLSKGINQTPFVIQNIDAAPLRLESLFSGDAKKSFASVSDNSLVDTAASSDKKNKRKTPNKGKLKIVTNSKKILKNQKPRHLSKKTLSKTQKPHPQKPQTQKLSLKKEDRQFHLFWKDKMAVIPGDNRRHIPLVAVMKGMLQSVHDQVPAGEQHLLLKSFERFITSMTADSAPLGLEANAKKTLSILTNLRSHIFLGHGHSNQILGSFADSLAHAENSTLAKIQQTQSSHELEQVMVKWSADFVKRMQSTAPVLMLDANPADQNRDTVMYYALAQFKEVVSSLNQTNYPDLTEFKAQAEALVLNLRDSYSTDISDAGHDQVRKWQNTHWLPMHQAMLLLHQAPSLEGLNAVLEKVIQLETDFAVLVSNVLNEQGFETIPEHFMMQFQTQLNSEQSRPVRVALAKLLQQPYD